jgi:hypothetical protein
VQAGKLNEAEEVFNMVLPVGDEATEGMHPGKEPLDFPSSAISAQRATVLGFAFPLAPVGCDHLDAVFGGELLVERVRVVGLVADEPFGELVKEASGQNVLHKLALGWRSAFDRYGERKTVTSGDSDDLGALATTGGAVRKTIWQAYKEPELIRDLHNV